jgi:ribonucleotide reductase alpha subunit
MIEKNRKNYLKSEVQKESINYFNGDTLAADVWMNKYCLKNDVNGETHYYELSPDDMHLRIATELNRIESKYPNPRSVEDIYNRLYKFKRIIPGGSPMSGIGNDYQVVSLSNCFVIGNEKDSDSYGGIMKLDQEIVQLQKRRGGVGTDLSFIRPAGSPVKNSAITSTGVVPFMTRFSNTTKEVAQDGRRGALMESISIKHPDAENFIDAKMSKGMVTGANISVRINDEFMKAVIDKKPYMQAYPITEEYMLDSGFGLDFEDMEYNKIYKGALGLYKKIDAEKLWKKIIHNAWKSAEPGVLFWDMIINESIPDCYIKHGFKTVSTNPCFRGDMKLLTSEGYKTFKELSELGNCNLRTKDYDIVNGMVWCNGVKEVYDVLIDDDKHIFCTKDHRFLTTDFEELPISECVGKQLLSLVNESNKNIVQSVTYYGNEDVYDFNLDGDVHWGIVEGVIAHNCGEIPICPNDSCRLMSLNLFSYVVNPFTDKAYFDFDLFNKDVIEAQRYMDDIIDLEIEKIDKIITKVKSDPEDEFIKIYELNLWEKIKEKAIQGRRTGLGITAEGDMIAAMGLRYGTDEATDFAVEVHKQLKLSAYRSSVIMAKERGCFPIYSPINEIENPFINRIKNEDIRLYDDMVMHGRRNIALLTAAPTGSVSICTQTTSGIEPAFSVVYMRRRKINPQEKNIRIDFVDDEGIAWMEYPVFHKNFELWLEVNGYDINVVKSMSKTQLDEIIKKSPYYKATSNDVDWVKKVEMQGKIQKEIDHSISVTVNVPKETTEEIVSQIYEMGWKSGCKGITIYRDGSRDGVLVTNKEPKTEDKLTETHAPKRPKRLKGDIHRFNNGYEKWIAVVGLKDGRPYEIFTGKFENGLSNLPGTVNSCEVVKNIIEVTNDEGVKAKKKRYDIEYIDADGNKHTHTGLNHAFNPEFWNYAKLISGILRHGMPLNYVAELIDSLNFREDSINNWKRGVLRTIKKYIKDGEKGIGRCKECGSEHLEYKEGCLTCMSCGSSKCS